MKSPIMFYYRKIHRYFGVIIGIQLLFWTMGGIFFTWSNMDQIHGDFNRKPQELISDFEDWQNPTAIFEEISKTNQIDSLVSFQTMNFLGEPFYQIRHFSNGEQNISLVNAKTGTIREALSKEEAVQLANEVFTPKSEIEKIEYFVEGMINKHHEYRNQPLPAYAIKFVHNSGTTVYVSTEYGQVLKLRNSNWQIFDFFWMMHTMDYQSRDRIGNALLRIFSVLGLITILTGFVLYFKTSKWFFRKNN